MSGRWFGQRFRDKGDVPHLFPWHTYNNDDLEILCKTGHACTHVDTQASSFYGHVTLGFGIHFLLFKSTQCFQNTLLYQFTHSSECIMGVRENFHTIHPSGVYTFFQQKKHLFWSVNFCSKKSGNLFSFQQHVGFLANQFYIFIIIIIFFIYSSSIIIIYLFPLSEKVMRMRAHTAYLH